MEKKRTIIGAVILVIIIVGVYSFMTNVEKTESQHENTKMEGEIRGVIEEVIEEQKQQGIDISINKIETYSAYQGFVKLDCENLDFDTEEKIIGSIVSKLVERYPEDYGENGNLWFDIETCSQTGSSPDGIETYYHPTQWMVSNGEYGQRI